MDFIHFVQSMASQASSSKTNHFSDDQAQAHVGRDILSDDEGDIDQAGFGYGLDLSDEGEIEDGEEPNEYDLTDPFIDDGSLEYDDDDDTEGELPPPPPLKPTKKRVQSSASAGKRKATTNDKARNKKRPMKEQSGALSTFVSAVMDPDTDLCTNINCFCGLPTKIFDIKKAGSKLLGHKFATCAKPKDQQCGFFLSSKNVKTQKDKGIFLFDYDSKTIKPALMQMRKTLRIASSTLQLTQQEKNAASEVMDILNQVLIHVYDCSPDYLNL
jgi:hypothetical protein